jgi:hypothetical protein
VVLGRLKRQWGVENKEIADRLRDMKREVEKIGFALSLLVHDRAEVENKVHMINCWIDDAIAALSN